MQYIDKIIISRGIKGEKVHVLNPTPLKLVGKGVQGAVFELEPGRCVKIYISDPLAKMEKNVLAGLQEVSFMPKLYESGPGYNIMEYFSGPTLGTYLKNHGMTDSIAQELLSSLQEMREIGFTRIDTRSCHIFITDNDKLKMIDHVDAFRVRRPRPIKLFNDLKKLCCLGEFAKYVKSKDHVLYTEWKDLLKGT